MPPRKRRSVSARRRSNKRKQSNGNLRPRRRAVGRKIASTSIIKSPSAFADTVFVKLKYTQQHSSNPSTSYALRVFRGNDLFDPDQTGVGHQPYASDQWFLLYQNCIVYGSKIEILVNVVGGFPTAFAAIRPETTVPGIAAIDSVIERPYSNYKSVNLNGGKAARLRQYMSTNKALSVPKAAMGIDEGFICTPASSPTREFFWGVYSQPTDLFTPSSLEHMVTITYYCKFFKRRTFAQS